MKKLVSIRDSVYSFLKYIIFFSLSLSGLLTFTQSQDISGIKFKSMTYERTQKTSVFLNNEEPIKLSGSFSISFKISFYNTEYYGPIIRIDDEKGNQVRLVYNNYKSRLYSLFTLSINSRDKQVQVRFPEEKLIRNNWLTVRLTFDKSKGMVSMYIDNFYEGQIPFNLKDKDSFRFVFGLKELNNTQDFDVPGMCIKDILITELNKARYYWSLDPRKSIKDEISGAELKIVNPQWVYKDHLYWRQLASINISQVPISARGAVYDSLSSNLLIDAPDRLILYNLNTGRDSVIKYKHKSPAIWNDLFYNQEKQVLYSYKTGMGKVSIYDIRKNEWIVNDTSNNIEGHYFGSGKFTYPKDENLYLLGGYGWNSVKKDLFRYDFEKKNWIKVNLKKNEMSPRGFFAFGKGFKDGEYFIYGGFGNESGNQDYGFKNYYDLYSLNMNDSTITKINLPKKSSFPYFILFNDSYLDKSDSSSYFISGLDENKSFKLVLNKLNLKTGEVYQLGNKFWKRKGSKWIYSDLYYNKPTNEFISVIFDTTNVDIYAIDYPIIKDSSSITIAKQNNQNFETVYLLIVIGLISITPVLFLLYKKRISKVAENKASLDNTINSLTSDNKFLRNSVKLFGGFHLYDAIGKDIIQEFSPKLKETFLLILLRSFNHYQPRGIASEELSAIIWPDYSPDSIKSNRGVTINKIRKILSSVDGISLEFQDKLWLISLSNGFTCDYLEFLKIKSLYNNSDEKPIVFQSLTDVLLGGEFLKGISYKWLDSLKFAINSEVIAFLKELFLYEEIKNDQDKIVRLCDIILSFDSVDIDATKKKIKILFDTGKTHIAKNTYSLFISEYQRLYDEKYPFPFEDIISE